MKRRSFLATITASLAAVPFATAIARAFSFSFFPCQHDFGNQLYACSKCGMTLEKFYFQKTGHTLPVPEPKNLRQILRWNPKTKTGGFVCRMSELRRGDKFIMYCNKQGRMPVGKDTFFVATSDPWLATGEPGLKSGDWTIEAEWTVRT